MRNSVALYTTMFLALAGTALAQQGSGYVKTKIDPGRAGVFIDGKYVGPAANFGVGRKYAVTAGEHEVRLSEPRYEDVVTKVTIEPGKTLRLAHTLKPLTPAKPPFGILRTESSSKFAAVYVNGKYMGHAGEFNNRVQGLKLNPGAYTVRIVSPDGAGGDEHKINIETGKTTVVGSRK